MILHMWNEHIEFLKLKIIITKIDNTIAEFKSKINLAKERNSKLDN